MRLSGSRVHLFPVCDECFDGVMLPISRAEVRFLWWIRKFSEYGNYHNKIVSLKYRPWLFLPTKTVGYVTLRDWVLELVMSRASTQRSITCSGYHAHPVLQYSHLWLGGHGSRTTKWTSATRKDIILRTQRQDIMYYRLYCQLDTCTVNLRLYVLLLTVTIRWYQVTKMMIRKGCLSMVVT